MVPPRQAFEALDKASPDPEKYPMTPHTRVRHDKIDKTGVFTLRHGTKLHHVGVGRAHKGRRVIVLVADLDIRVLSEEGELLRHLTLDPEQGLPALRSETGGHLTCIGSSVHDVMRHHMAEGWDLNPRTSYPGQLISSESDSAALAPLRASGATIRPIFPEWKQGPRPREDPKGTGSVGQRGPCEGHLRVSAGIDPTAGRPLQLSRFLAAKNKTDARRGSCATGNNGSTTSSPPQVLSSLSAT